jgi:predicted site-specific integrase-resolvase
MPDRVGMPDVPLVPTGTAAKALGVAHSTLARWWQEGRVTPALVTPGGHARWDVENLREQLRALRRGGADSPI